MKYKCHKCGIVKDESEWHFYMSKRFNKIKRNPYCNLCTSAHNKKYRPLRDMGARREARREYARLYVKRTKGLSQRKYQVKHPDWCLWYYAKCRARKAGVPFDIEPSDVVIPSTCPVLGIPVVPKSLEDRMKDGNGKGVFGRDNAPSIDRIVPSLCQGQYCGDELEGQRNQEQPYSG